MENCVFCKIIKGEIPCNKVYEDKEVIAFLDISPAAPEGGHTLVMPKKHYELLTDMPDNELATIMKVVKKVTSALLKISEGANVIQNNKRVSGQIVPHVHFHIIPRKQNDGVLIAHWASFRYKEGEMDKIQKRIKENL